jgi:signal peptide peptidase SppA
LPCFETPQFHTLNSMKILDILSSPWAIEPSRLLELQSIYATHLKGEKIDIAAIEARLGRPLANEPKSYDIIDGVAVLPIDGIIAKRMNLFSQISGGTSTQLVGSYLQAALADPAVHSIILSIDSPGGTVDGTQALADAVMAARDVKPIVTLADGTMASAAYWIGSAAKAAYIADVTTTIGSIGIVATHKDISQAEAAQGVKTTEISAGKYKRIASQYAPLSQEGRQSIQDQLDYTYSLFVGAVAKNRGVSVDTVIEDMADGRTFIGQQAIDAGLVDGVSTLDALVAKLNQDRGAATPNHRAGAAHNPTTPKGTTMLTAEQVAAEHPAIAAAFRAEGATAERERIQSIESQSIPGHEALITDLKFDGKSTAGDAAQAVLAAERSARTRQATALANEAPNPLTLAPAPTVTAPVGAQAQADAEAHAALPVEERCKAEWEKTPALRQEFATLAAYTAFARADESGRARILKRA